LIHLKKKEADIDDLILNLYKDLADGIIDGDDYRVLNERYLSEKDQIREKSRKSMKSCSDAEVDRHI
jgi:hypothetical protein